MYKHWGNFARGNFWQYFFGQPTPSGGVKSPFYTPKIRKNIGFWLLTGNRKNFSGYQKFFGYQIQETFLDNYFRLVFRKGGL